MTEMPTDPRAMETMLARSYARPGDRAALDALLALDQRLGAIVRGTRETMVGQMRLTWWYEALAALDRAPAPAEPVLAALAAEVVARGVAGERLATMIEGWEVLLDDGVLDQAALERFGAARGGTLFTAVARVSGEDDPRMPVIGAGWALADLGRHLSDAAAAGRATTLARERLGSLRGRWVRSLRPLAALALLARDDLDGGAPGSPRRVARLLAMRLTGR